MHIRTILKEVNTADDFPYKEMMPDGFFSFMGGSWYGEADEYGIIDGQLNLNDIRVNFILTMDQARGLIKALSGALDDASAALEFDPNEDDVALATIVRQDSLDGSNG